MVTNITFWSESIAFPLLTTLTIVPLAAMLVILFSRSTTVALGVGFASMLLNLFLSFYLLSVFDPDKAGIQLAEQENFFGFTNYSVGVDGLSVLFIPLTAILVLLILVYKFISRHDTDWKFIACLLGYEGRIQEPTTTVNV